MQKAWIETPNTRISAASKVLIEIRKLLLSNKRDFICKFHLLLLSKENWKHIDNYLYVIKVAGWSLDSQFVYIYYTQIIFMYKCICFFCIWSRKKKTQICSCHQMPGNIIWTIDSSLKSTQAMGFCVYCAK